MVLQCMSCRAVITDVRSHAIQMKYCGDGGLGTAIARHCFDEHRAHGVIDVILQGLAHMHECDFVHGDMKPENALLTSNSIVKLTDFGTSASLSDEVAMLKHLRILALALPRTR